MMVLGCVKKVGRKFKRAFTLACAAVWSVVFMAVSAFAGGTGGGDFTLTSSDLDPMLDSISANVKVVFPVVLIVGAMFIIIPLVIRLIKKASNG